MGGRERDGEGGTDVDTIGRKKSVLISEVS